MKIEVIKKYGFIVSSMLFPLMLLVGFMLHPDLFAMNRLKTAEDLASRFHHNQLFHIGHLIVMFAVPFIIVTMVGIMNKLQVEGKIFGFWGGIIGIFGAFILAVDKGALCLVLSAFDTLPEHQFSELIPFLQPIVDKAGLLVILWLLPLLPIGAIIQTVGLMKESVIRKWQGIIIIIGLLLLNSPEIELISTVGSMLMCIGYLSWSVRELRQINAV